MRHPSIAASLLLVPAWAAAQTLPPVTITRILPDTNSVKVEFTPVPGALDYRIYDATNPTDVKYAGLVHVYAPWGHHFAQDPASPKGAANGAEIVRLPLHLQDGDFAGPGFDSNHPEVASIALSLGAISATQIEWNGLGGAAVRAPVVHDNHGVITFSPVQPADFSGGRILHVTFEVDAQVDGHRWLGLNLAPAADPLTNWYSFNGPINKTNQALFVQIFAGRVSTDEMTPIPPIPPAHLSISASALGPTATAPTPGAPTPIQSATAWIITAVLASLSAKPVSPSSKTATASATTHSPSRSSSPPPRKSTCRATSITQPTRSTA